MFYASPFFYWGRLSSGGSLALLSQDKKRCYYLNQVASFLWPVLSKGATLSRLTALVCREFDISSEIAREDVQKWLKDGLKEGYIVTEKELSKTQSLLGRFARIVSRFFLLKK